MRSSPTTARSRHRAKKKILGLNAARLYDIEVPADLMIPEGEPGALAPT